MVSKLDVISKRTSVRTTPLTCERPWETPRPDDFSLLNISFPSATSFVASDNTSTSSAMEFSLPIKLHQFVNGNTTRAYFSVNVPAGKSTTLSIVVAVSNQSAASTLDTAKAAMVNFTQLWDATLTGWSTRYQQAMTPGNDLFSGSLPVLVTNDSDISSLWYQSIISILTTMRTNLLYPRVYATVGPSYGTTIVYAWDTSLWSSILALLDPAFLKEQVGLFLKGGVYNGYAVDYLSEQLVGPWYSANDIALFTTMLNYLDLTGDSTWLQEPAANGSTNLAQMEARATKWMSLRDPGFDLADYGGLSNLLEVNRRGRLNGVTYARSANLIFFRRSSRIPTWYQA